MFDRIQSVPNPVGDETSLQGHGVEGGHCVPGTYSGKENIADERDIVAEGQDEDRGIEARSILYVKNEHQGEWKKVVAEISEGQKVGEPGNDPALHPERRFHAKQELVDLNQGLVDIGMEVMDQVTEGFIDQDDEKEGRKDLDQSPEPSRPHSIIR